MNNQAIFAFEFKEKRESKVLSVLLISTTEQDAYVKFRKWAKKDCIYDVDFRTVKGAGSSVPLALQTDVLVLHQKLLD